MANKRDLKRLLNNTYGELIETVGYWQLTTDKTDFTESDKIVDDIISDFDSKIKSINDNSVENVAKNLKAVKASISENCKSFLAKIDSL